MSICFSLAQEPLNSPNLMAQALGEFGVAKSKSFDLSSDASRGAVWKAGVKGLEALMYPSLKSKGVLFLVQVRFGLYPTYKAGEYKTYEALLNGQRYAITFKLVLDGGPSSYTGWAPFLVQKISEFSAVKANTGAKPQPPALIVSAQPLNEPNDFYANVGQAPSANGFYLTPSKPIQGTGSIVTGKQQPSPKMVGTVNLIASGI
jgi:hypothetical protein